MDLAGGNSSIGTSLQLFDRNNTDAQIFTIYIHHGSTGLPPTVDRGTNFIATILNTATWMPITADTDNNVRLRREYWVANQHWHFTRELDGSYIIRSTQNNRVLGIENHGTANWLSLQMQVDEGRDSQRWFILSQGNGVVLRPRHTRRVMDLTNAGTSIGTRLQIVDRHNNNAQIFSIYAHQGFTGLPPMADLGTDFNATILNTATQIPIIADNDNNIRLGETNKIWHFTRELDGSYIIRSTENNRVLGVENFGNATGLSIQTQEDEGRDSQRWFVLPQGNGFVIRPRMSPPRVIDVDGSFNIGTRLQLIDRNNSNNQIFSIKMAELNIPPKTATTVTSSGEDYIFNISITNPTNGVIIVSTFDNLGRMVEVKTAPITASTINVPITMSNNRGAINAKVMIWDGFNNMKPLILEPEVISSLP